MLVAGARQLLYKSRNVLMNWLLRIATLTLAFLLIGGSVFLLPKIFRSKSDNVSISQDSPSRKRGFSNGKELLANYDPPDANRSNELLGRPSKQNMKLVHTDLDLPEIERLVGPGSIEIPRTMKDIVVDNWLQTQSNLGYGTTSQLWWSNGVEHMLISFDGDDAVSSVRDFSNEFTDREIGNIELAPDEEAVIKIKCPVKLCTTCKAQLQSEYNAAEYETGRVELETLSGSTTSYGPTLAVMEFPSINGSVQAVVRNALSEQASFQVLFAPVT